MTMASLRQEHHYGLSCGKNNKNSPNRTLYHVKLTDTAIRALEAYQNLKISVAPDSFLVLSFSGLLFFIPAPTPESSSALRVFSFYLSSDSKDQPQASFDCIHQYFSSDGVEQLEGQGVIQDKITVCATDDSYQMTRERIVGKMDAWYGQHQSVNHRVGGGRPIMRFKARFLPRMLPQDTVLEKNTA
uniref:RNA polymerase II elongation factor ELL2-like n=1 Tax=Mastacembelus armatus TaxID=205130 RepID=A0A7N9ANC3_9TELE